jgi:tetratricopeptide (TPR) repeat protein
MARSRADSVAPSSPDVLLQKATLARTSGLRAKYAERGLSHGGALDRTTRAMLLRQLYLSHMEARRFSAALEVAEQMVTLDVMPDVARQDAARACLGLGDLERAIDHIRLAGRVGPASRRAFHLWTLGSILYLSGRPKEALGPLSRAVRWSTNDKPLYQAQVALARLALGERVQGLAELRERLAESPCGNGYGQFVLGELAFAEGDYGSAQQYLKAFVRRIGEGRIALQVALHSEMARARRLLRRLRGRVRPRVD